MSRKFVLVALWAVFAGAGVGVGFGAAGLVGGPFTGTGPEFTLDTAGTTGAGLEPAGSADGQSASASAGPRSSSSAGQSAPRPRTATAAEASASSTRPGATAGPTTGARPSATRSPSASH